MIVVDAARSEFGWDPGVIKPLSMGLRSSNNLGRRSFHIIVDWDTKFSSDTYLHLLSNN